MDAYTGVRRVMSEPRESILKDHTGNVVTVSHVKKGKKKRDG
jgi:hypothetical protein